MVVGAQTKELKGNVALFVSDDLKKWQWKGNMLDSSMDWGYMCECPDLADMGERQFLIVSRQKEDGCKGMVFAGIMDYEQGRFHISEDTGVLLDEGFDFYAPQTFTDESGRRLLMGWIGAGEIEYQMSQPTVKRRMAACAYDTAGSICEERPAVSEAGRRIKTSEKERRKHLWNRRDCNRQTFKVHGDIGRGSGKSDDHI